MTTNTYEEALARLINSTLDSADKLGQFAVEELPQVVTEALHWYFAYNLLLFIGAISVAVVLVIADYKIFKAVKETEDFDIIFYEWGALGLVLRVPLWWLVVGHVFNLQWLKIWIAPKLWLIEFAARLIK